MAADPVGTYTESHPKCGNYCSARRRDVWNIHFLARCHNQLLLGRMHMIRQAWQKMPEGPKKE
jgi:hypothetical protein